MSTYWSNVVSVLLVPLPHLPVLKCALQSGILADPIPPQSESISPSYFVVTTPVLLSRIFPVVRFSIIVVVFVTVSMCPSPRCSVTFSSTEVSPGVNNSALLEKE